MQGDDGVQKPWEHPWTPDEMRQNASSWTLAGDSGLLKHLQSFSEKLVTRSQATTASLESMFADLDRTSADVANVTNAFLNLSNTQYVENRVYEDEERDTPTEKAAAGEVLSKEATEQLVQDRIRESLANGLAVMDTMFNVVEVPGSDSEDEGSSSSVVRTILEPKNPYLHRPLPHVIGTTEFTEDDRIGLGDVLSDNEDNASTPLMSARSSVSDLQQDMPPHSPTSSSRSDSDGSDHENGNDSMFDTSRDRGDMFGADSPTNLVAKPEVSFAEQLAAKLGGVAAQAAPASRPPAAKSRQPPDDMFSPPAAKSRQPPDDMFSPPDDDDDGDSLFGRADGKFSGGRGLFDDLEEEEASRVPAKKDTTSPRKKDVAQPTNNITSSRKESKSMFDTTDDLFGSANQDQDDIFSTNRKPTVVVKSPTEGNQSATKAPRKKPEGGVSIFGADLFAPRQVATSTPETGAAAVGGGDIFKENISDIGKSSDLFGDGRDDEEDLFGVATSTSTSKTTSVMTDSAKKKLPGAVPMFGSANVLARSLIGRPPSTSSSASSNGNEWDNQPTNQTANDAFVDSVSSGNVSDFDRLAVRTLSSGSFEPLLSSTRKKSTAEGSTNENSASDLFAETAPSDDSLFQKPRGAASKPAAPKPANRKPPSLFHESDSGDDELLFSSTSSPSTHSRRSAASVDVKPLSKKSLFANDDRLFGKTDDPDVDIFAPTNDLFAPTKDSFAPTKNIFNPTKDSFAPTKDIFAPTNISSARDDDIFAVPSSSATRKSNLFDFGTDTTDDIFATPYDSGRPRVDLSSSLFDDVDDLFAAPTKPAPTKTPAKSISERLLEDLQASSPALETKRPASPKPQPPNTLNIRKPFADIFADDNGDDDLFAPSFNADRATKAGDDKKKTESVKPTEKSAKNVLSGDADIHGITSKVQVNPVIPTKPQASPAIPSMSQAKPDIPTKSESKPDILTRSESKPDIPTKSESRPDIPTKSESKPDIPTKSESKPDIPTKSESRPDIPTKSESKPDIPTRSESKPDILTKPQAAPRQDLNKPQVSERKPGTTSAVLPPSSAKTITGSSDGENNVGKVDNRHGLTINTSALLPWAKSKENDPLVGQAEPAKVDKADPLKVHKVETTEVNKKEPSKVSQVERTKVDKVEPTKVDKSVPAKVDKVVGKVLSPRGLNIDPTALLPGAKRPKVIASGEKVERRGETVDPTSVLPGAKQTKATGEGAGKEAAQGGMNKALSFDEPVDATSTLHSVGKERAKIPVKRRPQSRRARQEAIRSSAIFPDDNDDVVPSVPSPHADDVSRHSSAPFAVTSPARPSRDVSFATKKSIPSLFDGGENPMSPSTDEEDLFGVPQDIYDVKDDVSNLFGGGTVLSPREGNAGSEITSGRPSMKSHVGKEAKSDSLFVDELFGSNSDRKAATRVVGESEKDLFPAENLFADVVMPDKKPGTLTAKTVTVTGELFPTRDGSRENRSGAAAANVKPATSTKKPVEKEDPLFSTKGGGDPFADVGTGKMTTEHSSDLFSSVSSALPSEDLFSVAKETVSPRIDKDDDDLFGGKKFDGFDPDDSLFGSGKVSVPSHDSKPDALNSTDTSSNVPMLTDDNLFSTSNSNVTPEPTKAIVSKKTISTSKGASAFDDDGLFGSSNAPVSSQNKPKVESLGKTGESNSKSKGQVSEEDSLFGKVNATSTAQDGKLKNEVATSKATSVLFDKDDSLFGPSKVAAPSKVPRVEATKTEGKRAASIFDDESADMSDLFSSAAASTVVSKTDGRAARMESTTKTDRSSRNTSLFDDDNDDDIFARAAMSQGKPPAAKSETVAPKKSAVQKSRTKTTTKKTDDTFEDPLMALLK